MMIKNIYKITSLIGISLILLACGPQGEAVIEHSCTLNGNGIGSCEFSNKGTAEGSKCVTFNVQKFDQGEESDFRIGTGVGFTLTANEEMCSGLVAPGDIRERERKLFFSDSANNTLTPYEFCETDSNWDSYSSLNIDLSAMRSPWYEFCEIIVQ